MTRTATALLVALILAVAVPAETFGQAAARRLSFAELASAVMQNNLQLRAAALDVAVAEAQLAQAHAGPLPQVGLSASCTLLPL